MNWSVELLIVFDIADIWYGVCMLSGQANSQVEYKEWEPLLAPVMTGTSHDCYQSCYQS